MGLLTSGILAVGLTLLVLGAELLVRGASRLAAAMGVSPLVIGLTVVAYGTSTPELAVSVQAGLSGNADIAVANVVGSNVFNVLFILGLSAAIVPLVVAQQLVRRDVPVMVGVSGAAWLVALDGHIGRLDGALLVAGIAIYTAWLVRGSRHERAEVREEYEREFGRDTTSARAGLLVARDAGLVLLGLAMLVWGSRWLVEGAVTLARVLGVSDVVIGLTIVAAGTSLPEVATSVVAAWRKERDIAVGNVVGSNIYNILAILGLSGLVTPGGLVVAPSVVRFDIPVMTAVAVACLPIFATGNRIARWEGILFLVCFAAYTAYLILDATGHDALPAFSRVMLAFVLPLLALTLAVVAIREVRGRDGGSALAP